jgi:hypothetical protein
MKSFARPLVFFWRWLAFVVPGLLLTACTSTGPREMPASAEVTRQSLSAPVLAPLSALSASLPSVSRQPSSLPGQAKSEDEEATTNLDALQVNESKLVGYHFLVTMGGVNPDSIWLQRPTARFPSVSFWTEPGYNGYQLVAIERKGLADLSIQQVFHLVGTLPEPMHVMLRSSSGRIVKVEAFHSADPGTKIKQPSGRMAPPTK